MTEVGYGKFGVPPWQLWGSFQQFEPAGIVGRMTAPKQLVRVAYGRPESWRFLLIGRYPGYAGPDVKVRFYLNAGIGRDVAIIQPVESSAGSGPIAGTPWHTMIWTDIIRPPKWTTSVLQPKQDDSDGAEVRRSSDVFVAQDINLSASVESAAPLAGFVFEVGAFVAPNVHVRPDWFMDDFGPGQLGGT